MKLRGRAFSNFLRAVRIRQKPSISDTFARFDPTVFPTAMSSLPVREAMIDTENAGRDEQKETKTNPIFVFPYPALSEIFTALVTVRSLARSKTTKEMISISVLINGFSNRGAYPQLLFSSDLTKVLFPHIQAVFHLIASQIPKPPTISGLSTGLYHFFFVPIFSRTLHPKDFGSLFILS